jgi:hypothetical protein
MSSTFQDCWRKRKNFLETERGKFFAGGGGWSFSDARDDRWAIRGFQTVVWMVRFIGHFFRVPAEFSSRH